MTILLKRKESRHFILDNGRKGIVVSGGSFVDENKLVLSRLVVIGGSANAENTYNRPRQPGGPSSPSKCKTAAIATTACIVGAS